MYRLCFLIVLLSYVIAGCAGLPVGKPISQIDIPEIDSAKSRVFFHFGKAGPQMVRIVSEKNGNLKTLGLFNHRNECTYVDLMPGDYKFRVASSSAGGGFWMVDMPVTNVSLSPGETYYIQVAWNYDMTFGYITNKRFNLILLDPEQGKAEIQECFYVGEENINLLRKNLR
jgi:hypothetical protein